VNSPRWRLAVPALVAALWLAGVRIEAIQLALLYCAPVIALAALLLSGRYPGERIFERRVARARWARPRVAPSVHARRRPPQRKVCLRLAFAAAGLAGRPPPRG
jgi:hypothetical protein